MPLIMLEFWADLRCSKSNFPCFHLGCPAEGCMKARQTLTLRSDSVGHDASDAGGGRPFRTPDPLLEPEDGAVHLRPPQQNPYHQPREDPGDVPGGAEVRAPAGREPGQPALRRDQASGTRN